MKNLLTNKHEFEADNQNWYKQAAIYRQSIITTPYKITINKLEYQLSNKEQLIKEFQKFVTSEIKDKIEHEFAIYVTRTFKNKLQEAFYKINPNLNDIITLEFSRSDFLFISPLDQEKMVIDRYKLHFQSCSVFDINVKLIPDVATTFRIYIPEFTAAYTKNND